MGNYLITGGAGFIGLHLAERLVGLGHQVRVLDNFSGPRTRAQFDSCLGASAQKIDVVEGDIRDHGLCVAAMRGVTHVLHNATISAARSTLEDPIETVAVNILGTVNLLKAAHDGGTVKRFINASSCAVYGDGPSAAKTESAMLHPANIFASTMMSTESLCENFFRSNRFCAGSLRYFNVYGESELLSMRPRSAVAIFIDAAVNSRDITVYGNGHQTRDFVHIDDAVSAVLLVSECEERFIAGQTYNIGSGELTSILDLLSLVQAQTKVRLECISAPARSHELKHSRADLIKARSILRYDPTVTISDGVSRMIAAARGLRKAA